MKTPHPQVLVFVTNKVIQMIDEITINNIGKNGYPKAL